MRLALIAMFVCFTFLASIDPAPAQQKDVCDCKAAPKPCKIECTQGCSAICGTNKNVCSVACRRSTLGPLLTMSFEKKTDSEIVSAIVKETQLKITFKPNRRTAKELLDYHLKNSDVWRLLEFLDKRGVLKLNDTDFRRLKELRLAFKSGTGVLPRFEVAQVSVENALDQLELMTGVELTIASGNPEALVSMDLRQESLSRILQEISKQSGVEVRLPAR